MHDGPTTPFRPLGYQLKILRQRINETLAEASGAVEIEVRQLASFELGKARPSEGILLLLISHFGAKDHEAIKIWKLAGYNSDKIPAAQMTNDDGVQSQLVTNPDETKIIFTDMVDVIVNNYGVVMNFMQGSSPVSGPVTVARVGMSREHAKSVLKILQLTLEQTQHLAQAPPRKLAGPKNAASDEKAKN